MVPGVSFVLRGRLLSYLRDDTYEPCLPKRRIQKIEHLGSTEIEKMILRQT